MTEFAKNVKEDIDRKIADILATERTYMRVEKKCWTELDTIEEGISSLQMEVRSTIEDIVNWHAFESFIIIYA